MEYVMILWLVGAGASSSSFGDLELGRVLTFPTEKACEEAFIRIEANLRNVGWNTVAIGHACIPQVRT